MDSSLTNYGTVTNKTGGTLINSGHTTIYNYGTLTNNSTLINYSTLTNSGILNNPGIINGRGNYTQTAGQTINNGSLSQTSIDIQGGILSGTGTITGNVTIGSGASVQPGNSPGTLTIDGDFYSSGKIIIEIAGLGSGQYDILNISGNAYFNGGIIEFHFINGYRPSVGDHWDYLFAQSINGWDTMAFNFKGLGSGWEFDTSGGRLMVTKTGSPALPALPAILMLLLN